MCFSLLVTTETGRPRIERQALAVGFGGKRLRFWSHGFVSHGKKVNPCGHIPVRDLTMTYSVNCKRRTLIHWKSIHESLRGSILDSIIAECKRKLSVEVFGASMKMVDPETPNNKLYWRSQQRERNVTTCVQLFDLTNKAT